MGAPAIGLEPGEEVVFRTRLHPMVLGGTLGFAAFVLGVVGLIVARNELSAATVAQLWVVGGAIVLLALAGPVARWWTSEFAVTRRRLLVRVGLIRGSRLALPIGEIEEIGVERTLGGRLLGYGTLHIVPSRGDEELFPRVAAAEALHDAVERERRTAGSTRR
jgi:hypothetical protein